MAEKTGISWCDHTFNCWWGCVKVSPGCDNCYAEADAHRYGHEVWGKDAARRFFGDKHWNEPKKWNEKAKREDTRHKVFCASMADVFEDNPVVASERLKLWRLISETRYLDYLLLTKRANARLIQSVLPAWWNDGPPNCWLGTTVESDEYRWRIAEILKVPALIHFLSVEPQIGPVDLEGFLVAPGVNPNHRIDWVIIGGESGHHAREFRLEWARDIIRTCRRFGVAIFNKQLGTVTAKNLHLIQRKGADPSEWPADLQVQEFPA